MSKTTNDGGPAFPKTGNFHNEQIADYDSLNQDVMSLRDYFAAKAPKAPKWFGHVPLTRDYEPKPKYWELPATCREVAASWAKDPCYDLIGDNLDELNEEDLTALRHFVDAWDRHVKGHSAWIVEDRFARAAQWAFAYADAMLAARSAEPPQ